MPNAEWRLFLPIEEGARLPGGSQTMKELLNGVQPKVRTDVYIKAGADVGVKQRGGQGLEFKALKERKTLRSRGAGHPGTVETFEKIKLGHGATPTDIIQHLRGVRGGELSRELEAAFQDPVEVQAVKTIRKKLLGAERGTVSFEVTDLMVTSTSSTISSGFPKKWLTFCVEGGAEDVEAFLAATGQPLVPLIAVEGVLQVGYPRFVQIIPFN